ncbi:MAG: tryptophan synthase subunit alpha, partial [Thermodesulfobacteriota bacterium]
HNKAGLVCYITAGDPDISCTKDIVYNLEKSGADIVELGIPFSDPMADGPTIQLASERALTGGTTLKDVIKTVAEIRKESQIPIILFGYYNPFLSYGLEKFAEDASLAGADGVLVVDLPPEESGEFRDFLKKNGLDLIFLLAPTSNSERINLVAENGSGFVYLVSVTGVTGARPYMNYSLEDLTAEIKERSNMPVGVGFGVSSPEQAFKISSFSDAVIVGSAIIKIIENKKDKKDDMMHELSEFVRDLSEACYR